MGKYEEALERARAGMPLDKVFPDLYESEDERIICNIKKAAELYWSDEPLNEILSWLEKQKEQKPAEWSEEDEFFRRQLIVYCDNCVQDSLAAKCVDWLKSLRPQQKQEVVDRNVFYRIADILRWCDLPIGCPVENFKQSESEREHLLEIVQCVAHRYANSCTYCKEYSRGYQDGLANHRWKPSDDQMIALEYFIRSWGESGTMSPQNPTLCAAKSLYNDLKKLL